MTTPKTTEQLTKQIEALVANHIDDVRTSAKNALERAFSTPSSSRTRAQAPAAPSNDSPSQRRQRRSPTQLAELGEKLYAEICEQPGESMAVFAAKLGVAVRELHRPMSKLRDDKRIRSVGQRGLARYFPAVRPRASA